MLRKPIAPHPWFRFQNAVKEGDEAADIYVYDFIGESWDGESVSAKKFVAELAALPKSVARLNVHINSPGGSVFDAVAIANVLREHSADVVVSIEGLAASAATIVAMGGDTIGIAENALFMIHDPYGFALGNAKDMRKTADALDRARDSIVATYKWHSPLDAEELGRLMSDTTWMTAAEAVERGFADEVTAKSEARAELDQDLVDDVLGAVPERFKAALHERVTVKVPTEPIASAGKVEQTSPPTNRPLRKEAQTMKTEEEIQAAIASARKEGVEEGRTAERTRILGIESALIPGHEKLVAELKLDPTVSPGDAALRINAAERAGRDRVLAAIRDDGKQTAVVTATATNPAGETAAVDDPRKPLEERAKIAWDNSPEIRAEFEHMGGFESYLEWRRVDASGEARILHAVK